MKRKTSAQVVSQVNIAPGIYDLVLKTDLSKEVKPGTFVGVYPSSKDTLLPRPISICESNSSSGTIRLVYRIAGKGTDEFSHLEWGDSVDILGILGNGFPVEKAQGKRVFLVGGGIGVPPILGIAKELAKIGTAKEVSVILGYRDSNLFLKEDFDKYAQTYIATEDGSIGTKGNVLDIIKGNGMQGDIIMACGPMPMLRAIKEYAREKEMEAFISLEERMACGVGACLGCVCKTTHKDSHSHVNNARICTDGPVFDAKEVDI